jgi:hypothetical protein
LKHPRQLQFSGEFLQRRDVVDLFFLLRLCFCVVTLKAKLNSRYRLHRGVIEDKGMPRIEAHRLGSHRALTGNSRYQASTLLRCKNYAAFVDDGRIQLTVFQNGAINVTLTL